jgi:tRNA pseudouridine32 synthase/23S rRNA pseudouridine746 synthase
MPLSLLLLVGILQSSNGLVAPSHEIFQAPNPATGRKIRLTPFVDAAADFHTTRPSSINVTQPERKGGGGVWESLLNTGGWMVHRGRIVPLFSYEDEDEDEDEHRSNSDPQSLEWFVLEPTLEDYTADTPLSFPKDYPLPKADDLLWLYKPDGLLTLPGKTEPDSLATRVNKEYFPSTGDYSSSSSRDKEWVPRPVHRLDLDTSGIVVMAKTKAAFSALSKQFEDRHVKKQYVALVHGKIEPSTSGTIDAPIGKQWLEDRGHSIWTTDPNAEKQREASTEYAVSRNYPSSSPPIEFTEYDENNKGGHQQHDRSYTRMILRPKTGRGHQLRLHMAEVLGHGILGDTLHGGGDSSVVTVAPPRLCLHAEYLEIWVRDESTQTVCKAKCWCLPPF